MMAFMTLEDFTGKGECIVFSDVYRQHQEILKPDSMVMAIGNGEQNGEALRIIVKEIVPMENVRARFTKGVILSINIDAVQENTIAALREVAERHRGKYACVFNVVQRDEQTPLLFQTTKYVVDANDEFVAEVERLLGPHSIRFSN